MVVTTYESFENVPVIAPWRRLRFQPQAAVRRDYRVKSLTFM
jgi:hypothetical protein